LLWFAVELVVDRRALPVTHTHRATFAFVGKFAAALGLEGCRQTRVAFQVKHTVGDEGEHDVARKNSGTTEHRA